MKTLDRYVIRNFLTAVIVWFIILMSLRVVTDLFGEARRDSDDMTDGW